MTNFRFAVPPLYTRLLMAKVVRPPMDSFWGDIKLSTSPPLRN